MRTKSATVAPPDGSADYERFLRAGHKPGEKPHEPHVLWTTANFVHFPDGDIQITGAHLPPPARCPRPRATEEEKAKKEADRARREVRTICKFHQLSYLTAMGAEGVVPERPSRKRLNILFIWAMFHV